MSAVLETGAHIATNAQEWGQAGDDRLEIGYDARKRLLGS